LNAMKIVHIILSLVLLTTPFISLSINASVKKNALKTKKEPIIKIINSNEIISKKQLEKIDPKTIKSIDVYPNTVFITLHDKMKLQNHKEKMIFH